MEAADRPAGAQTNLVIGLPQRGSVGRDHFDQAFRRGTLGAESSGTIEGNCLTVGQCHSTESGAT